MSERANDRVNPKCALCPVADAGLACRGQSHPRDCAHVAAGDRPDYWPAFLVANARPPKVKPVRVANANAANADAAPRSPPYPPGGIVQLWPLAVAGGAERSMLSVLKATPDLPWRGVAILSGHSDPAVVAEVRRACPVAIGPEESRRMILGADLLIAWWAMDFPAWLPEVARPATAMVSHSPGESPYAMSVMASDEGVDHYVAVSRAALEPIPAHRREDAAVIPNAVDPSRLEVTEGRESVRASWGLPPGAKVLGGLNRLSAEKRSHLLIDAVAALPPEWFGVLVGEGHDRAELERHAAAVAPGRIVLPGARLDAGNVLDAFDRLLVASEYESFCLTMAEALWMGRAVVSTPVGVASEHPEAVRSIPLDADGPAIAAAVLDTPADPGVGREVARRLWSPEASGAAWSARVAGWLARHAAARTARGPDPRESLALPGLLTRGINYAASTARHLANGGAETSPEVQARRLAICDPCPMLRMPDRECSRCGCPVDAKVKRPRDACPEGKWQAEGIVVTRSGGGCGGGCGGGKTGKAPPNAAGGAA